MATPYGAATAVARQQIKGWSPELRGVLDQQRDRLASVVSDAKLGQLQKLYENAAAELETKLRDAVASGRGDTFGALQHRTLLAQARQGIGQIAKVLAGHSADLSHIAQVEALRGLEVDIARLEKTFTGAMVVLPTSEAATFAGAIQGRRRTLLEQHQASMAKWGQQTVDKVADEMALSMATGETTDAAVSRIAAATQASFWRAERIVRTETAWAYNATLSSGIDKAADELGDIYQRWVEFCTEDGKPLDARVGVDSIAMHGQLSRPGEQFFMPPTAPFPDAKGGLEVPVALIGQGWPFPPNRPNDRAVIQPWRPEWGIPAWVYVGGKREPWTPDRLPPRARRVPEVKAPEPEPELAPEPPPPPPELTSEVAMAEKVGDARGSNQGGFYRGSDGVTRYVKLYADPAQAQVEHLAGTLYRDLGLPAPVTSTFAPPPGQGQMAFASEVLPGFRTVGEAGLTAERAKELTEGFVADVLLGNWDVMGLEMDNVGVSAGKVYRIDNGSAFWFRARGGIKAGRELMSVGEFDSFFDPSTAPTYSRVLKAAGIKQPEDMRASLRAQMAKVRAVRDANGGWAGYVDKVLPKLAPDVRQQMIDVLTARDNILGDYCNQSVLRHGARVGQDIDRARASSMAHGKVRRLYTTEYEDTKAQDEIHRWIDGWTSGGRTNHAHMRAYDALAGKETGMMASDHTRSLADAFERHAKPAERARRWKTFMEAEGINGEVPTHIEVYRGVGETGSEARWAERIATAWMDPSVAEVEVPCDAVASFSRDPATAAKFSSSAKDGAILRWRAPLHHILADQIADDGSFVTDYAREREVIAGPLKGGLDGKIRLPKHEQVVRWYAEEYTYADREKLFAAMRKKGANFGPGFEAELSEKAAKAAEAAELKAKGLVPKLELSPDEAKQLWQNIVDPGKQTAQLGIVLENNFDAKMNILTYKKGKGKEGIAEYLTKQGYPNPSAKKAKVPPPMSKAELAHHEAEVKKGSSVAEAVAKVKAAEEDIPPSFVHMAAKHLKKVTLNMEIAEADATKVLLEKWPGLTDGQIQSIINQLKADPDLGVKFLAAEGQKFGTSTAAGKWMGASSKVWEIAATGEAHTEKEIIEKLYKAVDDPDAYKQLVGVAPVASYAKNVEHMIAYLAKDYAMDPEYAHALLSAHPHVADAVTDTFHVLKATAKGAAKTYLETPAGTKPYEPPPHGAVDYALKKHLAVEGGDFQKATKMLTELWSMPEAEAKKHVAAYMNPDTGEVFHPSGPLKPLFGGKSKLKPYEKFNLHEVVIEDPLDKVTLADVDEAVAQFHNLGYDNDTVAMELELKWPALKKHAGWAENTVNYLYPEANAPPKAAAKAAKKVATRAAAEPGQTLFLTKEGYEVSKNHVEDFLKSLKGVVDTEQGAVVSLEAFWPDLKGAPGYAEKLVKESAVKFGTSGGVQLSDVLFTSNGGAVKVTVGQVQEIVNLAKSGGASKAQIAQALKAIWPGAVSDYELELYVNDVYAGKLPGTTPPF